MSGHDARPMDLPDSIGPYRVQRLLDAGGMGEVYLAEQREPFHRIVAVKLVRADRMGADRLARFDNEIRALAALSHDGIARIFDAGSAGDRPYFAMEYVPGRHVTDYCTDERLDVAARLRLFVDVCRAVAHAHRHGIVHRDLKPSNILAHGPRSAPTVKIIDFGLAKLLDPRDARGATDTVAVIGSLDYMCPEQIDAARDVDTRADVYALGAVLYELLTGMQPLALRLTEPAAFPAALDMIRSQTPSTPSRRVAESSDVADDWAHACRLPSHRKLSRSLAGDLDRIVMKALAKRPDDRYPTVEQLADDVELFLRDEPIRARPRTAGYVLRKFVRRHRRPHAIAPPLAVLLLASVAVAAVLEARAARDRTALEMLGLAGVLEYLVDQDLRDPPPPRPEALADLEAWRAGLDAVRAERDRMVAFVDGAAGREGIHGHLPVRGRVQDAVETLDAIVRPDGYAEAFDRRVAWARRVREQTVTRQADAWRRAIAAIAADRRFEELGELTPQVGLVPIGADPKSRFQEFALPVHGCEVPRRDEVGRLVVTGTTCPVFVLLPGGTTTVGSQDEDPARPRYDPGREPFEDPVAVVRVAPFFASKYEFTNGQWSALNPDAILDPTYELHDVTRPCVLVSDFAIEHVVGAWGMRLPTAAEWEYLARGDTDTPWWCGGAVDDLQGKVNLYDASVDADPEVGGAGQPVSWSDGHVLTAPVGSLEANEFGLHHVLGNALEVVRVVDPDTGEPGFDLRGGSWHGDASQCRITWRAAWSGSAIESIGFRPVVSIRW